MKYKALVDYYSCDFGDGITHKWTIGKYYKIVKHEENEEGIKISYDIQSDSGISTNVPVEIINEDMMRDTFGIDIKET